jgi:hypothetical protein
MLSGFCGRIVTIDNINFLEESFAAGLQDANLDTVYQGGTDPGTRVEVLIGPQIVPELYQVVVGVLFNGDKMALYVLPDQTGSIERRSENACHKSSRDKGQCGHESCIVSNIVSVLCQ